jgi:hypothetical protein
VKYNSIACAALLYLALPNLLFILDWLQPHYALPLALLVLAAFWQCCQGLLAANPLRRSLPGMALILAVAMAWTAASGIGGLSYANPDWQVRYAVLRDLIVADWPPNYTAADSPVILRSAIAYYLPVALFGKAFGIAAAHLALLVWTTLGVTIFLALLPLPEKLSVRLLVALALVVFFGGMDVLGMLTSGYDWPNWPFHIEWWAEHFQYSSITTQLFWVPNHALPAWIAGALLFRLRRSACLPTLVPLLLALLPLWTPFALIGLLPFAAMVLLEQRPALRTIPKLQLAAAVALGGLVLSYLALDIAAIPGGMAHVAATESDSFATAYLRFVLFEFGLLALAILRLHPDEKKLLVLTALVLLVLPLFRFGLGNDLVMRASIPALVMLLIMTLQTALSPAARKPSPAAALFWLCLLFGAVTAEHEIERGQRLPRWQPNPQESLTDKNKGQLPAHYLARLRGSLLEHVFRNPGQVPSRMPVRDR